MLKSWFADRWLIVLGWAAMALALSLALNWNVQQVAQEVSQPIPLSEQPYVQSTTCQRCHPEQYASWHRTYHRTMTQAASPQAVQGDFDSASYGFQGVTSRFFQQDGQFFIETLGPSGQVEAWPIVMTVGSRRFQQYVTKLGDQHIRLPFAWDINAERWLHLNGGFLDPDGLDFSTHTALWDANCIFCHNVKPNPGYNFETQTFASEVAEMGIACEACHGPGTEHIERNTNPVRRYFLHLTQENDPTIITPPELAVDRQNQICGHCHGQRLPNPPDRITQIMSEGDPFTVGENLHQYVSPMWQDSELPGVDLSLRFWADGTPRLTAYEYQGLLLSTEHEGELRCTDCHSMHGGNPKGMITAEMRGPQGCVQCHSEIGADIPAHTQHAESSTGSDCYACHQPKNTYGLLDIHRTHHIRNPEPARAWRYNMPEACTLCHTNKSLRWAATEWSALFNQPLPPDLPPADDPAFGVAESVRTLASGDVVQRAVALTALSAPQSYTSHPSEQLWTMPFLLWAIEAESYPALRYMAHRNLLALLERAVAADPSLPPLASLPTFDGLAEPAERSESLAGWWAWWTQVDKSRLTHPGPAIPLSEDFSLDTSHLDTLLRQRDNTPVSIGE